MIRQMAQNDPIIAQMISNPNFIRSMLTPETMRFASAMMQNMRANPYGGMPNPFMFPNPPASASSPAPAQNPAQTAPNTGAPFMSKK